MRPSVSLWHPFTPGAVGLSESSVRQVHSKPHLATLKHLAAHAGWRCTVEYMTEARLPWQEQDEGVTRRFWPLSLRWREGNWNFRQQWSLPGLASAFLNPPDVLILNMSGHGSNFTRAMGRACRVRGRPYIAMIGGLHYSLKPEQVRYYREAAAVVTHSRQLKTKLEQHDELAGITIVVLPLGINTDTFRPAERRKSLGEPGLLYVGRVIEWKGIHIAIDAFSEVKEKHPGAELHIVGPESDPAYSQSLREQIRNAGLATSVHFHGLVPYDELPDWYQSADLFLLPSRDEGFGMVAIESLGCGTPVVALDAPGGPLEILTHGEDGVIATAEEYRAETVALLGDDARLHKMRQAARRTAVARYSQAATIENLSGLISDTLAGAQVRR